MKKFITTLQNIWKIEELRGRILLTIGILAVYRFASYVTLPGVDPNKVKAGMDAASSDGTQTLFDFINLFSGGAFNMASVMALGIMPYITASIIIQLLGFAVPYFQRLQQQEGESGRKKIGQITRMLTLAITLVQGGGYLTYVKSLGYVADNVSDGVFWITNIIILSAGTIFAMWLGEKITDKGIGNGISLLITVGIVASLPTALLAEYELQKSSLFMFIIELVVLFFVIMATVMIVQAVRKIPIQFAKRAVGRGADAMPVAGARDFIPLKVNAAGVMPIIFAQALMFLPATIGGTFASSNGGTPPDWVIALSNPFSLVSTIIVFVMVVLFTYVYTALLVNPTQYAEYLKRQNAFIPGIKPGTPTSDFIDTVTTRITLPGSVFLGLIAILPAFASMAGINQQFAYFFGGTSLLIIVAVILDTLDQVESHLLMRKYDGLVKDGRIQGRSRMQGIGAPM